jgi:hypothetical protein
MNFTLDQTSTSSTRHPPIFFLTSVKQKNYRNTNFLERHLHVNSFIFIDSDKQSFQNSIKNHIAEFPQFFPVFYLCGQQTTKIFHENNNNTFGLKDTLCFTQNVEKYSNFLLIRGYDLSSHSASKGSKKTIGVIERAIRLCTVLRSVKKEFFSSKDVKKLYSLFTQNDQNFIKHQRLAKTIILEDENTNAYHVWPDTLKHLEKFEFTENIIANIKIVKTIFAEKSINQLLIKNNLFLKNIYSGEFVRIIESTVEEHGVEFSFSILQSKQFCQNFQNKEFLNAFNRFIYVYGKQWAMNVFLKTQFVNDIENKKFNQCFEAIVANVGFTKTMSLFSNPNFSNLVVKASTDKCILVKFQKYISIYDTDTTVKLFCSSSFIKNMFDIDFEKSIENLFSILNANKLNFVEILQSGICTLLFKDPNLAFNVIRFVIDIIGIAHCSFPFRSSNFLKRFTNEGHAFKQICRKLVTFVGSESAAMLLSSQSFSKYIGTEAMSNLVEEISAKIGFKSSMRLLAENCFLARMIKNDDESSSFKSLFFSFLENHGAALTTRLFSNGSFCVRFCNEQFHDAFQRIALVLNDIDKTVSLFQHGSVACGFTIKNDHQENNLNFEQRIVRLLQAGAETAVFSTKIFCDSFTNNEDLFLFFIQCLEEERKISNKCFQNIDFLNKCAKKNFRQLTNLHVYSIEQPTNQNFEYLKNKMLYNCKRTCDDFRFQLPTLKRKQNVDVCEKFETYKKKK